MDPRTALVREHMRRGHQKVVLEIDFAGSLKGFTEITIIPTTRELKTIHLNSRQCVISAVAVNTHQADFLHHDSLSHLSVSGNDTPPDCHRHPELKRKVYSAMQDGSNGELSIALPKEVVVKQAEKPTFNGYSFDDTATPEPQAPGPSQTATHTQEFSPIVVKITYSLTNPADGFEFVLPSDTHPHRVPHAYTTPSSPDAARCWVPCIDTYSDKCTWEFEFIVPRYLEEESDEDYGEMLPTRVICSGELVEQIAHPYNSNKTIYLFTQAVLTSVQHISFAAGPFHMHTVPADSSSEDTSQQPQIYTFCLPGMENMLSTTTSTLRSAMSFYSSEFGSYPFGSYKIVFVDELPTQRFDASTMCIASADILHGDDAIEPAIESRHLLSHALAVQWIGVNIQPKTWSDLWLVNGLAAYISGLFIRKLLGNNEYRFRMKRDMQRVVQMDNGTMPPICEPHHLDPPGSRYLPFINLKAPLVLHILDRRLGKSGTSLGLSRVLPKVFLSAISGEMQNNALSTHAFLRMCRKVSGVDLRMFADQWIYGSGCPSFHVSANFNRKKMAVEITMRQECPAWVASEADEVQRLLLKPVHFFEGQMTIRIHEADGTPYEHVLDIQAPFKRFEVPFNTKYKRVRRNTKRYLARQAAAQAAADGDADAREAMSMIDVGFGLDFWENATERANWRVADWTEDDESMMSGATYEWIRMDADFEWISALRFDQPDFMWVSQLQRDRDVVAQLEAVEALSRQPNRIVSSTLTRTVLVSNYHYQIRCAAAIALAQCALHTLDFIGLFHLFKLFLRYCYDPEDPNQDLFSHRYVPKPNDFSDLPEYFVRKALINAIAQVRFEGNGKTPPVVRRFLSDQLRYNDNTSNAFNDAYYICTIITASACANIPTAAPERAELLPTDDQSHQTDEDTQIIKQAREEVERYRNMDRLIPSPHNVVTIAALEFHTLLSVANLAPNETSKFFPLTREGNYTSVRIVAFEYLFLTKWWRLPSLLEYALSVMINDSSRAVRRHVARSACQSLAILVQMGEFKNGPKDADTLLIEEDGGMPEKAKDAAKKSELDQMIRVLRKDKELGKSNKLRDFLMPILISPNLDHEARWAILKLADVLVKPTEEAPPTVKIHIPVHEPVAPKVQQKPIRLKPPPAADVKAPLGTSTNGPPKLKISANTARIPRPATSPKVAMPKPLPPPPPTPSVPQVQEPTHTPKVKSVTKVRPVQKEKGPKSAVAPVSKAPSGKISLLELRACTNMLKKLQGHKHAKWFQKPVDPIRDQAPNYPNVISKPMDLSNMAAKLSNGIYPDRHAFHADFRLIIKNAKTYNASVDHPVHKDAIALETYFEKQWSIMNKTLESRALPPASVAPKPPRVLPPVPTPVFEPPVAPRPTLKLKLGGGQSKASPVNSKPPKASEAVKPSQPRKIRAPDSPSISTAPLPTPLDVPPPPYVDDGSADLYEEVLAIEREKDEEKRVRPTPTSTPAPPGRQAPVASSSVVAKRKRSESTAVEEPATRPLKKERSVTTATPKASPVASASTPPPAKVDVPAPRTVLKLKKDVPVPISESPAITPSRKGKERDTGSARPTPSRNSSNVAVAKTPFNAKKCKDIMKTLTALNESYFFLFPVDRAQLPEYFVEIKHPMDYQTMNKKIAMGSYDSMEAFASDMDLILRNCRQFNPPNTEPTLFADVVEQVFKKEWAKAMEPKLTYNEKKSLSGILSKVTKDDVSFVFREPVDPIREGLPDYHNVIPKEKCRDLSLMKQKLDSDKYTTVEAFREDFDLMVDNAIHFNGPESGVSVMGNNMRAMMYSLVNENQNLPNWSSPGVKKRKTNGATSTGGGPPKKMKLSV